MIEANAQTDLAVAKAAGIKCFVKSTKHLRQADRRSFAYYCDDTDQIFSPTTDLIDAWEAAEAVGLFDPAKGAAKLERVPLPEDEISWCLEFFIGGVVWTIFGPTPELAICEAIIGMEQDYEH